MASSHLRSALILLAILLLGATDSHAGLKIYYIRHAEAGHNVAKEWAIVPRKQWPDFVGDPNMFTPKGEKQRISAIRKLKRYDFDFIAVSPMWRCRNTILPYLKETGSKGEIWPELHELYASSMILAPDLPAPTVKILGEGTPIELPPEEAPYFFLREDGKNNFRKPPFPPDHADKEGEAAVARLVIQRVLDLILERFGGSDKTILLVGHGSSGMGILRMLTNETLGALPYMTNTGIWMVEEQATGEFELKIFNDVPLGN